MQFTVPQFIEKEAKIVGPLSFKQFIYVGIAAAICVFLYFVFPIYLFAIIGPLLIGASLALAFYKKEGIPLPNVIAGFFTFLFKPKIYLWKKKGTPPKFLQKQKEEREGAEKDEEKIKGPQLKIHKTSNLNELSKYIETK